MLYTSLFSSIYVYISIMFHVLVFHVIDQFRSASDGYTTIDMDA